MERRIVCLQENTKTLTTLSSRTKNTPQATDSWLDGPQGESPWYFFALFYEKRAELRSKSRADPDDSINENVCQVGVKLSAGMGLYFCRSLRCRHFLFIRTFARHGIVAVGDCNDP